MSTKITNKEKIKNLEAIIIKKERIINCLLHRNFKIKQKMRKNGLKVFNSPECVICLKNPPDILFCNCGHLCTCEECNELLTDTCPVCREISPIKRKIEREKKKS